MSRITFHYVYMDDAVQFAVQTLKELSPVGTDKHAGLYRDSHLIFLDGHVVKDASGWQPGQQVEISNPVPYSRKIELGTIKVSVPPHVYEGAAPIVAAKYPSIKVQFTFMPLRFSGADTFQHSLEGQAFGKRANKKALRDWEVAQPTLILTAG